MLNASQAFKDALRNDQRAYLEEAVITLYGGTTLTLTNEDIWGNSFTVEDAVSSDNVFQIGTAISNSATLTLNNVYDDYTDIDFTGAKVVLYVGLNVQQGTSVSPEMLRKGTYVVYDAVYDMDVIKLSLVDNMSKFDKGYSLSRLVYPATLDEIVRNACSICDVTFNSPSFPHSTFVIDQRPDDSSNTFRDVIAYVAQIAGCYARCDNYGRLELKWFDFDTLNIGMEMLPFLDYLDTTDGMTAIISSRQDEQTNLITGVNWFTFNGKSASNIYVNSNSWISFATNTSGVHDLEIFSRDGQLLYLYRQEGTVNGLNFLKLRYDGYSRYQTTYQTPDYHILYELFLLSNGKIILNVIAHPTVYSAQGFFDIRNANNALQTLPVKTGIFTFTAASDGTWDVDYSSGLGGILHAFRSNYALSVSADDVVITGVKISVKTDTDSGSAIAVYRSGSEGYEIGIENNPLITADTAQDIADWLGLLLIGRRFRKANLTHSSDPTIEAGDIGIVWDRKGRTYPLAITRTKFAVGSAQATVCGAETPARNSAARFSQDTKNYVELRKQLIDEKTDFEQALEDLSERLDEKNAMYTTVEQDEHGHDVAWYLHDQPTLAESAYVWKMTASAWGVSTDGGATWNAGMTVDGDVIARIMNTIGINFEWGTGGTLTLGGSNNTNGWLRILNASGTQTGKWDNAGISITKGSIDLGNGKFQVTDAGALTSTSGTIGGFTIGTSSIYNSKSSLTANSDGVYIGTDGIAAGRDGFKVTSSGAVTATGTFQATGGNYKATLSSGELALTYNNDASNKTRLSLYGNTVESDYDLNYTATEFYWNHWSNTAHTSRTSVMYTSGSGLYIFGGLTVGGTKNRTITTDDYGDRLLYCYETPSPLFGDVGEGTIAEDGKCYVQIDSIFAETVSLDQYQVFIQKYGDGDCWVSERKSTYFLVEGTAGLPFGWELKAKQKDYDQLRLERTDFREVDHR